MSINPLKPTLETWDTDGAPSLDYVETPTLTTTIYSNNLENWEFEAKPMPSKTNSSSGLSIQLDGQRLLTIPEAIFVNPETSESLLSLSANCNQLSSLSDKIQNCWRLETLSLCNNKLMSLPEELGKCQFLRVIDISHNQLENLPPHFGNWSLQILQAKDNQISLDNHVKNWINIVEINLEDNQLDELPQEIKFWGDTLTTINLANNCLEALPKEINAWTEIEEANFNYNNLDNLPSIAQWKKIKSLLLNGNGLASLPEGIEHCKSLQRLELESNPLETLPETIGKCTSLQYLNVADTDLNDLPTTIGNLQCLKILNLTDNTELATLPEEICNLSKCVILIEGCGFSGEALQEIYERMTAPDYQGPQFSCSSFHQIPLNVCTYYQNYL